MCEEKITVGCIIKGKCEIESVMADFWDNTGINVENEVIGEVTFRALSKLLHLSNENNYIEDENIILGLCELNNVVRAANYDETINSEKKNKDELITAAEDLLCGESLRSELDRIYAGSKNVNVVGNPVHYMVISDNVKVKDGMVRILHTALYSVGRLTSQRYCTITLSNETRFLKGCIDQLFASCSGGLIYVKLQFDEEDGGDLKRNHDDVIDFICNIMNKYKNKTLVIFGINRKGAKMKEKYIPTLAIQLLWS
jgi:hypothetical protein